MKAILFIDQHYQEDIHLEDVAQNLSFSISYASRLFKKYTGVSFVKYLSMVRIKWNFASKEGAIDMTPRSFYLTIM